LSERDTFLLLRSTPRAGPIKQADDLLTEFYRKNGPCCAGCDHWHWQNSRMGECHKAAPVSGADRIAGLGIHGMSLAVGAGHPITGRHHHCGDFIDTDPTGCGKGAVSAITASIICAAVAVLCLLDASLCVFLGHSDWWFPATGAAMASFLVDA